MVRRSSTRRAAGRVYDAIARLKPGVSFEQAQLEMRKIGKEMAATYDADRGMGRELLPMNEDYVQAMFKPALIAVLGITAVVLLIACANVANLMLSRAAARKREMGIRLALRR